MNDETFYTVHEDGGLWTPGFYAATHPSEALPACWTGPNRPTPEEAAADHGAHAAEALKNFREDSEE